MAETLTSHICQTLLSAHAVPEDTQLCLVTKLLILSSALSLSPDWTHAHARTRARSIGGREDVKSFHAQKISSLEIHSPKDVDLPTERMSQKNINI